MNDFISIPCPEFLDRPIVIRVRDRKIEYQEGTEGYQIARSATIEEEALFQAVKDSLTVCATTAPTGPNAEETATIITESLKDLGWDFKPAPTGQGEVGVINERVAQLLAHRPCVDTQHDPQNGFYHGCCVICTTPWPCDYAGSPPVAERKAEDVDTAHIAQLQRIESVLMEMVSEMGFAEWGTDEHGASMFHEFIKRFYKRASDDLGEVAVSAKGRGEDVARLKRVEAAYAAANEFIFSGPVERAKAWDRYMEARKAVAALAPHSADRSGEGGKGGGG